MSLDILELTNNFNSHLNLKYVRKRGRTSRKRKKKLNNFQKSDLLPKDETKLNLLSKWMGENGFKLTKRLHPFKFMNSGRGLITKERILAGDIIVSIPAKLLIIPKRILNGNLGKYFRRFCPKASGHQILSVFLMCEKVKRKASEWYPYMMTLPQSYDIPGFSNFFSSISLPASMNPYVEKQIEAVRKSYDQLKILFENLTLSFPHLHNNSNFELYKWAWCTVNTRCIYIDCFLKDCPGKSCTYHLALAPYLDLLNHSSEVQVHAGFNKETNQYEIKSLVDFKKYSQVFINYGPHDNRTLLFEYGFILSNNQNDFVPFSKDDVTAYGLFDPISDYKLKIIEQNNLFSNMNCSCDGISWNLSEVLRILSSDEKIKWRNLVPSNSHDLDSNKKYKILKEKILFLKFYEYKSIPYSKGGSSSDQFIFLKDTLNELYSFERMLLLKAIEEDYLNY